MTINGTPDNDDLFALGQNEEVFGFEGDDTLDASGGDGNNTLDGGEGNDELYANHNDTLIGGIGEDSLYAIGILGNNSLDGGEDNDSLFVVEGDNNTLVGNAGNDELYIIEGSLNILQGGIGHDFLQTSSIGGNNTLEGGDGDDTLIGYLASDRLFGDAGNDSLYAGKQGTQMTGGDGLDRFYFGNGSIPDVPAEVLDFTTGDDQVIIAGIPQVSNFENIILEQDGNDTLVKALIDDTERIFGILKNVQADTLTADEFGFIVPVFSISDASAVEGNAIAFTVTRTDEILGDQTVTVTTSIASGDTASESDFTAKTETLTFAQGETTKTLTVQTTQDALFEGDETFTVTLSNPTNGSIISSTNGTAKGTITNDDPAPIFSIAAAQSLEGSDITFTITRTGDAQNEQSVTVATSIATGDTASESDFTANTQTLTFAEGETSKTFTVQTTQETEVEANETFTVTLSSATNGAVISSTNATAQGTITDDDTPTAFSIAAAEATEGNDLIFTITRTGDAQGEQSVTITTSIATGDTASEDDFTPKTETLTFAVGETEKTFTVETTQDTEIEANETFTATLSNATNGATISSTNGTAKGTINDDDIPLAAITNNNNIFTITGIGSTVRLKATLVSSSSSVVNELGVFIVEDEEGTITTADGISIKPGEEGYQEAALERAKTHGKSVFSAIANLPDLFRTEIETNNLIRLLGFDSGSHLKFFLVREGTIDGFRSGSISSTNILFADSSTQNITQDNNSYILSWKESTTITEFNSLVVRIESTEELLTIGTAQQGEEAELIDLTDANLSDTVQANFSVFREAAFNNEVYFYKVDNVEGQIGTLTATAANRANYLQAAINNIITNSENGEIIKFSVDNQGKFTDSAIIATGSILAPMIVVNGTLSQLTDNNTGNDPQVYFPYLGLNNEVDHIRLLGDNVFGFEDLPGGGDLDYNDVMIRISFTTV